MDHSSTRAGKRCSPGQRLTIAATAVALLASLLGVVGAGQARAAVRSAAAGAGTPGYWVVASDGSAYGMGTASLGGMQGVALVKPVVGGAATTSGLGYWEVASDGGIFTFGDARFFGSAGGINLWAPIVGMAADPATAGYWMVASDGGVFSYNAQFYGSTGGIHLAKPIVAMAPTATGKGYWLVASDGGVFAFGDAHFYGSKGAQWLPAPVVGMAVTPDGGGYWLVGADGSIYNFGDAGYFGSTFGMYLVAPVAGMAASPDGKGYWLVASDGGIFTFGDARFLGSTGAPPASPPAVAILETSHGYPFPPGGTGYDISQWQCGDIPPSPVAVAVVQVSGGAINNPPNSCYSQEANWAGSSGSAYIFMDQLPATPPAESLSGPGGVCNGDASCEGYNFGYYWTRHWVDYAHQSGHYPSMWWLDVEGPSLYWAQRSQQSNSQVVAGGVAALRAAGLIPGIYATALQWQTITGDLVSFPNIALWVPGAGNLTGPGWTAQGFCSAPPSQYAPFAGGRVVLVQYGWVGDGYTGPSSPYDLDYACP